MFLIMTMTSTTPEAIATLAVAAAITSSPGAGVALPGASHDYPECWVPSMIIPIS